MSNDDTVLWRSSAFGKRTTSGSYERPVPDLSSIQSFKEKKNVVNGRLGALGQLEKVGTWYVENTKTFANSTIAGAIFRQLQAGEEVQLTARDFDPVSGSYTAFTVASGGSAAVRAQSDTWMRVTKGPMALGPPRPRPMSIFVPNGSNLQIVQIDYPGDADGAGPLERDIGRWNSDPGTLDKDMDDADRIRNTG